MKPHKKPALKPTTASAVEPKVLVLTGYGINCDEETKFAFETAGAKANIIHINDLIARPGLLNDYQIFAFPGGFSFGDDTGSGYALAAKIKNHLWDEFREFINKDNLMIGICNGFQVMVNLGLLPALDNKYGERQVALLHNDSARYNVRWVDLEFHGNSPWIQGLPSLSVPIAHGEGKFYADKKSWQQLKKNNQIAARYVRGKICKYQSLEPNPNGSLDDIAGITDKSGRLFGLMPHPERATDFTNLPNWPLLKETYKRAGIELSTRGPGLAIFENGVNYFK